MTLLIGSRMLEGVVGVRQPSVNSDYDIITSQSSFNVLDVELTEVKGYKRFDGGHPIRKSYYYKADGKPSYEIEIAVAGSTAFKLLDLWYSKKISKIDLVYTLKMSHRYLRNSPHFEKTHKDIKDLRKLGAVVPDVLKDWLVEREQETYYYKHPNLNQSKDQFFDTPNVIYVYDHDSIHESVAIDDRPAYTNFLVGEVKTSKELFEALPLNTRLNAVLEESCVLAIERSLINYENPSKETVDGVWVYSLQKVCTSITSGWFREFAWENYELCKKLYYSRCSDYYERFTKALNNGKILPHKEK